MEDIEQTQSFMISSEDECPQLVYRKRRVCIEPQNLLALLILNMLLLCVFIVLVLNFSDVTSDNEQLCLSVDCIQASASILGNINPKIDPCEDFYEFSCGRFTHAHDIPPEKSVWNIFGILGKRNSIALQELLASPHETYLGENSTAMEKVKSYYIACMNTTATELRGIAPAINIIKKMNGWTLTKKKAYGAWDQRNWQLSTAVAMANKHAIDPFFSWGVGQDDQNSSQYIISFDQGGISLGSREFYAGNNSKMYHHALTSYIKRVTILLKADPEVAEKVAEDIWQFEAALARLHTSKEERVEMNKNYHKMKLREIKEMLDDVIDLEYILDYVFGQKIPLEEDIVCYAPEYFPKLKKLLNRTPDTTLVNYIVWHVVDSVSNHLPMAFRMAAQDYAKELQGQSSIPPQWETCTGRASGAMPLATGALFIQSHFGLDDREHARGIINRIRTSFEQSLPSVTWMDAKTKITAMEKVRAINQKIGFSSKLESAESLDKVYESLNISIENDFDNFMRMIDFSLDTLLKKRGQPVDKAEWEMAAQEVNAYYSPNLNEIVFPAGILQKPLFHKNFPMSINFGAIGMIMGHELTHGFDNTGRLFDKNGNLNDWWQESSVNEFKKRSRCMVDQYSNYHMGSNSVNGMTTLGENLADNGGLKTSLHAYHTWLNSQKKEKLSHRPLPGVNLTNEQLFYVSFAQVWCISETKVHAQNTLITDVHSPMKYRVIGTLSNNPEFSKAFKCDKSSVMNPSTKCQVW